MRRTPKEKQSAALELRLHLVAEHVALVPGFPVERVIARIERLLHQLGRGEERGAAEGARDGCAR